MSDSQVRIRPSVPGDTNFIISTWLKSFKHSSYFAKRIRNSIFFLFHHDLVARILANPETTTIVACHPADENVIYGYLVQGSYQGVDLVHYVYVKSAFRRMGIARQLSGATNLDKFVFNHWTFATDFLVEKLPGGTYIPYLT